MKFSCWQIRRAAEGILGKETGTHVGVSQVSLPLLMQDQIQSWGLLIGLSTAATCKAPASRLQNWAKHPSSNILWWVKGLQESQQADPAPPQSVATARRGCGVEKADAGLCSTPAEVEMRTFNEYVS